jgi:hypothetical protein
MSDDKPLTKTNSVSAEDGGFELDPNDARSVRQRGGIAADTNPPREPAPDAGEADGGTLGTTEADIGNSAHDVGATSSGRVNSSQVAPGTTGILGSDFGPPAAGPVDGSASGASAPQVEMSDVGLVDLSVADMSPPGTGGPDDNAQVNDKDGNPL